MADAPREAWITGVGIVSTLGEGVDAHWQKLSAGQPAADATTFAPFVVHPLAPVNFDAQIPKKGDQRQMENWQRIGTYAAGLALDSAGVKGKPELLSQMDMIVAAGGGERDLKVDATILNGYAQAANPAAFLNERLMGDLRPTLFLAQLSNLLAGNISIVHGVTGSSRTFMGEESAGFDAVRIALSRIAAGQSDIALVGGAHNGERPEMLMLYEFAGECLKDKLVPVWERGDKGGFALGSLGAFLVIEARDHAEKRGAKPLARLTAVVSDRASRQPGTITETLGKLWDKIKDKVKGNHTAVLSGATGAPQATVEERAFLQQHGDLAVRATGTYLGHGMEPQFAMNVALATVMLAHGSLYPPCDQTGLEKPMNGSLDQVVVTGVGHWRGEGMALVERVG
ncbi:3-oxoacyl-ACP synthase [Pseudolabrys sp. Root1462]|jgi:3-oxoacyl-[acyl-carrier-protein] synthase II|uniref:beta-ketoacyl-ACP synthase n=1 Tax=Pseudolabrys sp. Root1462 TaxID=1736466 RepID=UPI0007026A43|nr:beta-ketoacyl-ACP synthase [Pseudolabrys sp. Root1462]KQZ01372.1 3-oxoacyl-ACP synthase [Pseudolabrys sp. Root1462]HTJ02047.1 beta-ketoacyl-ACP synthase [Methylovirgula sp.]